MEELEQLNTAPGTASPAQQVFMVYMTASVTLFPISILGYRMQTGSAKPAYVFVPLLLARAGPAGGVGEQLPGGCDACLPCFLGG